jgi:hypothetical protein
VDLKHLLKRGALIVAANWPVVAIQFIVETTFQVLLMLPVFGAAVLVAILLGRDLGSLLQGNLRQMFTTVASALLSVPVALVAFIAAFCLVLFGGSILLFIVKGGIVDVIVAANAGTAAIEFRPLTLESLRSASRFTLERFMKGCSRLWRRYLRLGFTLMIVYGASAAAYIAVVIGSYRALADQPSLVGWKTLAALAAALLVVWITVVNFVYLLLQVSMAVEDVGIRQSSRAVARFVRAEFRSLMSILLVVVGLFVIATLASALAWSGVGLIAFVPLVGLAVFPLQLAALVVRGLAFQYLGLTALGAYVKLYAAHAERGGDTVGVSTASPASAPA